jgi:small subunit ribosomal protein S9
MSSAQYYEGIGRRKAASARVRLFPGGTGKFIVNDKPLDEYLPRRGDVEIILQPLIIIGQERSYDISVHVDGGGISGQRDAIKLGVSRALLKIDPDTRGALKAEGHLTRDARIKERKKPGLKRARKAPTFTKR